eukprot:410078-Pelagomonas_calceolata.AAC.4
MYTVLGQDVSNTTLQQQKNEWSLLVLLVLAKHFCSMLAEHFWHLVQPTKHCSHTVTTDDASICLELLAAGITIYLCHPCHLRHLGFPAIYPSVTPALYSSTSPLPPCHLRHLGLPAIYPCHLLLYVTSASPGTIQFCLLPSPPLCHLCLPWHHTSGWPTPIYMPYLLHFPCQKAGIHTAYLYGIGLPGNIPYRKGWVKRDLHSDKEGQNGQIEPIQPSFLPPDLDV